MSLRFSKREVFTGLSPFLEKDRIIVQRQMKGRSFSAEIVTAVARRCPHGCPQVLQCRSLYRGRPFPTLFWLCCPHLSYQCGVAESMGGVRELEAYLKDFKTGYRTYNARYALTRLSLLGLPERLFLRLYRPALWKSLRLTGVGGIRNIDDVTVKCLHLQTAACLALEGHPAETWLKGKLGSFSCEEAKCLQNNCHNLSISRG